MSIRKRDDEGGGDEELMMMKGWCNQILLQQQSMGSTEMGVDVLFVHSIPRETHILRTVNAGAEQFISNVGRQY